MSKETGTQASLAELLREGKKYYSLQKKYLRYTAAEQVTQVVSKMAIVMVIAVVAFIAFVFLGLGLVHWYGATTGNLALGYALFGAILIIVLLVFYLNRRRWVILPIARVMMQVFLKDEQNEDEDEEEKD